MAGKAVKICCRLRPWLPVDKHVHGTSAVSLECGNTPSVTVHLEGKGSAGGNGAGGVAQPGPSGSTFHPDVALDQTSTQADVFESICRPIISSLMTGVNASIICYGQTGSGKTHTMHGHGHGHGHGQGQGHGRGHSVVVHGDDSPADVPPFSSSSASPCSSPGLASLACAEIFRCMGLTGEEVEYTVGIAAVEVYMEGLRDLLGMAGSAGAGQAVHAVKLPGLGNVRLSQRYVVSMEELQGVVAQAEAARTTGSTAQNERSSRSHGIIRITITARHSGTGASQCSTLSLVDLAGSEQAGRASSGVQLGEASAINKSLLTMHRCIAALAKAGAQGAGLMGTARSTGPSTHIPYRDSKLTVLLKDCLGGTAVTTLILCISPSPAHAQDTLATLRFGAAAARMPNAPVANRARTLPQLHKLLTAAHAAIDVQSAIIVRLKARLDKAGIAEEDDEENEEDDKAGEPSQPALSCAAPTSIPVPGSDGLDAGALAAAWHAAAAEADAAQEEAMDLRAALERMRLELLVAKREVTDLRNQAGDCTCGSSVGAGEERGDSKGYAHRQEEDGSAVPLLHAKPVPYALLARSMRRSSICSDVSPLPHVFEPAAGLGEEHQGIGRLSREQEGGEGVHGGGRGRTYPAPSPACSDPQDGDGATSPSVTLVSPCASPPPMAMPVVPSLPLHTGGAGQGHSTSRIPTPKGRWVNTITSARSYNGTSGRALPEFSAGNLPSRMPPPRHGDAVQAANGGTTDRGQGGQAANGGTTDRGQGGQAPLALGGVGVRVPSPRVVLPVFGGTRSLGGMELVQDVECDHVQPAECEEPAVAPA